MKLCDLLLILALSGTLALLGAGCDNDAADDAASGDTATGTSGDASASSGAAAAGDDAAEEAADTSPIPEEQYNQLKEGWSLQILTAEESAKTVMKINEEHKDEQLAKILEELNTDIEALREKHKSITPENGRLVMTVEMPKMMEAVGIEQAKAMERMQEVVKSKIPGG